MTKGQRVGTIVYVSTETMWLSVCTAVSGGDECVSSFCYIMNTKLHLRMASFQQTPQETKRRCAADQLAALRRDDDNDADDAFCLSFRLLFFFIYLQKSKIKLKEND